MPANRSDLHGNAPDTSPVALVLIDVISDFEFDGGDRLLGHALPAARCIAELRRQARDAGIPAIYANDNFGRWRSDFREVVEHCLHDGVRGEPVASLLRPEPDDYFVLKPKHSAFFATTMDTLLEHLGVRRLVLTGFSGDFCVLLSAADVYMRDFDLQVPSDCVASVNQRSNRQALAYMRRLLGVRTTPSTTLDLRDLRMRSAEDSG